MADANQRGSSQPIPLRLVPREAAGSGDGTAAGDPRLVADHGSASAGHEARVTGAPDTAGPRSVIGPNAPGTGHGGSSAPAKIEVGQEHAWTIVVDLDRCTGCQACVAACWAENNVPINTAEDYETYRPFVWIRVERYWEGEYPNIKARYLPILCQHCGNAPCEPVCPVYATYHSPEGLNFQTFNRCVGTRYCQNNCPYMVRMFNFFEPSWPESLRNQLNPDVTVRSRGVMEKCNMCVQRIRRAEIAAAREGRAIRDGEFQTACAQACPTSALIFGDLVDPNSRAARLRGDRRNYQMLAELGTAPSVTYLKKVDPNAAAE